MTAEHSPEPWLRGLYSGPAPSGGMVTIQDSEAELVACIFGATAEQADASARRLLACMNACRGYDIAALELFGQAMPKDPDGRFLELCRSAYRSMYSQQKHLDPDNSGQWGHGRDAMDSLAAAFRLVGASLHGGQSNG